MAITDSPDPALIDQCVHCGFCHGFACEVVAKASTLTTVIPEAEATGRCEVRPDSYVARVEVGRFRHADGEEVEREVVHHPGAVAVVAHDDEHVWLVRQPREATRSGFVPKNKHRPETGKAV